MAGDVVHISNQVAPGAKIEDPVKIAFAPAKPTLDALAKLQPARNWLAEWEKRDPNHNHLLFDLRRRDLYEFTDTANERLAIVPEMAVLEKAKQLFYDAEHVPAPPAWYALAFGAMLAAAPNTKSVSPAYTFGLIDSILYDEDLQEGYGPGFSCPVVVCAIRQLRRDQSFIPAPAEVLQACLQHRRRFRDLGWTVAALIRVRQNAEELIAEDKKRYEEDFGPFDDTPIEPRPPGWRPPDYREDNSDCPF
jgi:hypothetical protein